MTKDCRFLNEEFVILRFEEQVNKRKIKKMSGTFSCFKGNLFLFIFTRFFFFLFLCCAISFKISGVSWCCGNYCLLAFVLWCGYCSVSFQSFVLRHWCPQHQETTKISGPWVVQTLDSAIHRINH